MLKLFECKSTQINGEDSFASLTQLVEQEKSNHPQGSFHSSNKKTNEILNHLLVRRSFSKWSHLIVYINLHPTHSMHSTMKDLKTFVWILCQILDYQKGILYLNMLLRFSCIIEDVETESSLQRKKVIKYLFYHKISFLWLYY